MPGVAALRMRQARLGFWGDATPDAAAFSDRGAGWSRVHAGDATCALTRAGAGLFGACIEIARLARQTRRAAARSRLPCDPRRCPHKHPPNSCYLWRPCSAPRQPLPDSFGDAALSLRLRCSRSCRRSLSRLAGRGGLHLFPPCTPTFTARRPLRNRFRPCHIVASYSVTPGYPISASATSRRRRSPR